MKIWLRFITWSFLSLLSFAILTACSNDSQTDDTKKFNLMNQDNKEVTVIGQKPALFFFFTTYT